MTTSSDIKEFPLDNKTVNFINQHIKDLNEIDKIRELKLQTIQSLLKLICIQLDLEGDWKFEGNKLVKVNETRS